MRVAVIGVGNVGSALASALTGAGHDVVVAATSAEKAKQAAAGLDCEPAPNPHEAVEGADAVVLAIPFEAGHEVADEIRDEVTGTPVIDVTNSPGVVEQGTSNAEAFQAWLPQAHVVKAFNTVFASRLAEPMEDGQPLDGFIAGDDPAAKATVATINEFEVMWQVPKEAWGDYAEQATIMPLDLDAEVARWGAGASVQ